MIALFKGSFTIDGVSFSAGEHVLNKEQSSHWYTQALISDKLVEVLQNDIEAEVVSEIEAPLVDIEIPQVTRKKRG